LNESGFITTPREVAEHLKARFETDTWRASHADKAIHEIKVFYSHHTEIPEGPVVEHVFEALIGQMTCFSYMMLGPNSIARRERSCWCEPCFGARGRLNMQSVRNAQLHVPGCILGVDTPRPWTEQSARDLGTGLAGRRKEAQAKGKELAQALKASNFFAVQAREQWSTQEDEHLRTGHYWLAQAGEVPGVTRISKRQTIGATMFSEGDYMVRVGRYFDRDPADLSGLTFEEWQPLTVFSESDVGSTLTIERGHVKVGRSARTEVYWGTDAPPEVGGCAHQIGLGGPQRW
jgi:hypothetical protein